MADRYWIGGTGSWQDSTKWSNISGGTGGFSIPTFVDNAYFDGNSGAGSSFKIRVSATAADLYSLNILSLTNSLSFAFINRTLRIDKKLIINDNKVYITGRDSGSLILGNYNQPTETATYNSVVALRNCTFEMSNAILKSDLSISNSISTPYSYSSIYENFNSNNKNISFINITEVYLEALNLSNTVIQNYSNSLITFDNCSLIIFVNYGTIPALQKVDFTNCEISLSVFSNGAFVGMDFIYSLKKITLPKINFNIGKLNSSGNSIEVNLGADSQLQESIYIPKLKISIKDQGTTNKGYDSFLLYGNAEFYIKELAISCSAENRIFFDGGGSRMFIESASLSQVVFARCNITGFRELSASFSASNIGVFPYLNTPSTGIKISDSKTVYWNSTAGGNLYSNNYTSATGGTVTSTWIPFPQDIIKFVDTGLNSSATVSFNGRKSLFLGAIDTSERTIPMAFQGSLGSNIFITNKFIANSNTTFTANPLTGFSLEVHGTCTLNIVPSCPFPVRFGENSVIKITSQLNFSRSLLILQSSQINFNEYTLSASNLNVLTKFNIINPPKTIILGGTGTVFSSTLDFESTNFRIVSTSTSTAGRNFSSNRPNGVSSDDTLKIKGIYFEGGSASYFARFFGNFKINDLIYNKIGNINIYLDPTANPLVVNHIKMMGQPNGSITASLRFTSNNISLTAVLLYAGVNAAESLSFIELSRIAFEPRRNLDGTYRVFTGSKSTGINPLSGVVNTDAPKIISVNSNNNVASNSTVIINTNSNDALFPTFSAKYKDINLSNFSRTGSSTFMATFPNYFANNIKVGAKHELKIIRGN